MMETTEVPNWVLQLLINALTGAVVLFFIGRWVGAIEQRLRNGAELLAEWKEKAPQILLLDERVQRLEGEREKVEEIRPLSVAFQAFVEKVNGELQRMEAAAAVHRSETLAAMQEVAASIAPAMERVVASTLQPIAQALARKLAA